MQNSSQNNEWQHLPKIQDGGGGDEENSLKQAKGDATLETGMCHVVDSIGGRVLTVTGIITSGTSCASSSPCLRSRPAAGVNNAAERLSLNTRRSDVCVFVLTFQNSNITEKEKEKERENARKSESESAKSNEVWCVSAHS